MADTVRTIAELQTLLADNTTGDISPQDLRDFMETFRHDHGEISLTTPVETSLASDNSWTKVAGTTAVTTGSLMRMDDDSGTNNRLRYTGTTTRILHIAVSISMFGPTSGQNYQFAIIKNALLSTTVDPNDTIDDPASAASVIQRRITASAEVGATALHAFITVEPNDYIELFTRNIDTSANITVQTMNFVAIGMPYG